MSWKWQYTSQAVLISLQMIRTTFVVQHTGALAQLGEHLLCKQGVIGSIPIRSTSAFWALRSKPLRRDFGFAVCRINWVGSSAG
jgi:hypothetical protein